MVSLFVLSVISFSCQQKAEKKLSPVPYKNLVQQQYTQDLKMTIQYLDSMALDYQNVKKHLEQSRTYFKKIEPVLSDVDINNYNWLNQPNILKVEEEDLTDIKIHNPSGFQVLEEEIYADVPDEKVIKTHIQKVKSRLKLIHNNTNLSYFKDRHILWIIRKAIIRIALTGITGFDSPVLENSLKESQIVYKSLVDYLKIYEKRFSNPALFNSWKSEIDNTLQQLQGDFNTFDRYTFIKDRTTAQLNLWNKTVTDWNVTFPFELAFDDEATSLFSSNTFNSLHFADKKTGKITSEKTALGKKLFYDTNLSKNNKMACATCHKPELAFTDGLKKPEGLTRNSPTLLYAALQQAFFYDKRAGSLEGQIVSVVENENEFHTNLKSLEDVVKKDSTYSALFHKAYPNKDVKHHSIRNAIATYIRTLTPFNSKLDKNIRGEEQTLTQNEINGFNLFHGKAKCATCHFAPLYNGTVPPDYTESEMELIGVPQKNDTINAIVSNDLGRYNVFKTEERKHFFKTSTVRNISKTAPYMHNGVYTTLEEVMDFYNRGGGAGIGIDLDLQTLPPDALNLTNQEIQDIIAFMNTLEDPLAEDY